MWQWRNGNGGNEYVGETGYLLFGGRLFYCVTVLHALSYAGLSVSSLHTLLRTLRRRRYYIAWLVLPFGAVTRLVPRDEPLTYHCHTAAAYHLPAMATSYRTTVPHYVTTDVALTTCLPHR